MRSSRPSYNGDATNVDLINKLIDTVNRQITAAEKSDERETKERLRERNERILVRVVAIILAIGIVLAIVLGRNVLYSPEPEQPKVTVTSVVPTATGDAATREQSPRRIDRRPPSDAATDIRAASHQSSGAAPTSPFPSIIVITEMINAASPDESVADKISVPRSVGGATDIFGGN